MDGCLACRYSSHGHCASHPAIDGAVLPDEDLVRAIDEHDRDVTEWESRFVESCLRQLEQRPLSPKQRAKAEEILDRLENADD